jgi:hypothetical protein
MAREGKGKRRSSARGVARIRAGKNMGRQVVLKREVVCTCAFLVFENLQTHDKQAFARCLL